MAQTLGELIESNRAQLERALPKHIPIDLFLRVVMTEVRRNRDLQQCSGASIAKCMMQAAQLGLVPDSLRGHAYLVPYKGECTLIPGYRGLIDLAYRSGKVRLVEAAVWYDCDKVEVVKGSTPNLVHVPKLPRPPDAKVEGAYAVIFLADDAPVLFDFMDLTELEKIRMRSQAGKENKGPWGTDANEMRKKTVARRALKYAPSSPDVQTAITFDELSEQGLLPDDAIDITEVVKRRTEERAETIKERHAAEELPDDLPGGEREPGADG